MTVADYCGTSICTVSPQTSLRSAAEQMRKNAVSLLLVADTGQTLGVISDGDLVTALADGSRDVDSSHVAEAMSKPAIAIRSSAPLIEAIALMRRKGVRHLPVLDSLPATGILTIDHVVRVLGSDLEGAAKVVAAQLSGPASNGAWPDGVARSASSRTAAKLRRKATAIAAGATLAQLAAQLKGARGGCVVVLSSAGETAGIITTRDVAVRAVAEGLSFTSTLAASIMSSPLVTAELEHTQQELFERMTASGIRRIPILEKGRLAGLVSLDDLVQGLGRELGQLTRSSVLDRQREVLRIPVMRASRALHQRATRLTQAAAKITSIGVLTVGRKLETIGERLGRRQS